jgi:hypothetical protein
MPPNLLLEWELIESIGRQPMDVSRMIQDMENGKDCNRKLVSALSLRRDKNIPSAGTRNSLWRKTTNIPYAQGNPPRNRCEPVSYSSQPNAAALITRPCFAPLLGFFGLPGQKNLLENKYGTKNQTKDSDKESGRGCGQFAKGVPSRCF